MSQQKELSLDKFVGIAVMVLAFLFIGPCISSPIYIEDDTILEVGRETLLEMYPGATIISAETVRPGKAGKLHGYSATYKLPGSNETFKFYAEGND